LHDAISGGAGDDGMVQRFGALAWPDHCPDWREVDRHPASEPRANAWGTFNRLDEMTPESIGGQRDEYSPVSYLRLDDAAQDQFGNWRGDLERRLRSGEMLPALEGSLGAPFQYQRNVADWKSENLNENTACDAVTVGKPQTADGVESPQFQEGHFRQNRHYDSDLDAVRFSCRPCGNTGGWKMAVKLGPLSPFPAKNPL
jgi:hypothetical protein